ncbi:MAG: CHAT domain-containing protein [Saprospiraceae bacterium]
MLIIYQIPIFDFRRFHPGAHFLKVPIWPAPEERDFVRGVGSVVLRRKGGLNNWIGESKICAARRSIRFLDNPEITVDREGSTLCAKLKPAFRRFYFDGMATGKYEIGFAFNSRQDFRIKASEIEHFVDNLLKCRVEIPIVGNPPEPALLASAGKKLARQYLHASSRLKTPFLDDAAFIKHGSPTVYADVQGHEEVVFDKPFPILAIQNDLKLAQTILQRQNTSIRLWIADDLGAAEQQARNLRISVLRLDLSVQALPKIFKEIVQENIRPVRGSAESEALQQFLLKSEQRILKFSREFDDQVIQQAKEAYDQLNAGERSALKEKLEQDIDIRRAIFLKMEQYAGTITDGHNQAPISKKILFIGANPLDTARAMITQELSAIREGIAGARERDRFELLFPEMAATPARFQRLLIDNDPAIIHFSGHGTADGIYLEDETGNGVLVKEEALSDLFALFSESVECVVLNACFSETQARAIARHIPYVVGMSSEIGVQDAVKFSTGFYGALAGGEDIPRAFELGKNLIDLSGLAGGAVPRLVRRD